MNRIAVLIGKDRADRLSAIAGGLRLSIPPELVGGEPPRALADRIGYDLAVILILHFPETLLQVPVAGPAKRGTVKVRTVATLTKRNLTANDIAKRLKCSVRTVYDKRAEARSVGLLPEPTATANANRCDYE